MSGLGNKLMDMSKLGLLAFGGNTHTGSGLTTPIVEIWECSLAVSLSDDWTPDQAESDGLADLLSTWFGSAGAGIASSESLDYVKWNEYSLATGHQVTDPTIQTLVDSLRGSTASTNPVTTSCRISIDNSTRDQRAKGGFYPPRCSRPVSPDGRFDETDMGNMYDAAHTLLNGINTYLGARWAFAKIGVWSRRDKAVHVSNRLRVGNVPDNVRRRKNHMIEVYNAGSL